MHSDDNQPTNKDEIEVRLGPGTDGECFGACLELLLTGKTSYDTPVKMTKAEYESMNKQLNVIAATGIIITLGLMFAYGWYQSGSLSNMYNNVIKEINKAENVPWGAIWQS